MTDEILERRVRGAFEGAPSLDASDIGVSVEHGIVTLRGYVGSHAQKTMAEEVALGVYGVRAVANDIELHVLSGFQQTDTEIAQAAVAALVRSRDGLRGGRLGDAERDGRLGVPKGRRRSCRSRFSRGQGCRQQHHHSARRQRWEKWHVLCSRE
jgi:BON domain